MFKKAPQPIPLHINDNNIHEFVKNYCLNKKYRLPKDLQNKPINEWDVSNVTNMKMLFRTYDTFNENINDWNVSNVTNMDQMFENCFEFNGRLDKWNTSNVTSMVAMFRWCNKFNNDSIQKWNTSNVTNMKQMFECCEQFNQPLFWDTSNVVNMDSMFRFCKYLQVHYTLDEENKNVPVFDLWNLESATTVSKIFECCNTIDCVLLHWQNLFNETVKPQLNFKDWDRLTNTPIEEENT